MPSSTSTMLLLLQAQLQALAAAQAQAQMQLQMQQALLAAVPGVAPVVPGAAGAIVAVPGSTAAGAESSIQRKAREIHVGNLAVGSATAEVLTELFNTALAGFVPDARITPPVKLVNLDATGMWKQARMGMADWGAALPAHPVRQRRWQSGWISLPHVLRSCRRIFPTSAPSSNAAHGPPGLRVCVCLQHSLHPLLPASCTEGRVAVQSSMVYTSATPLSAPLPHIPHIPHTPLCSHTLPPVCPTIITHTQAALHSSSL